MQLNFTRKLILVIGFLFTALSTKAQWQEQKYNEGCIYDTAGNKRTGLLANYMAQRTPEGIDGSQVYFKSDKAVKKKIIHAEDMLAFIVNRDSFVVSHDPLLTKSPFLLVLIDKPAKLYALLVEQMPVGLGFGPASIPVTFSVSHNGVKVIYYYGDTPNKVIKLQKKNFIEAMSIIVADKPDVVANIKSKKLRYRDIDDIVEFCKTGYWPLKATQVAE